VKVHTVTDKLKLEELKSKSLELIRTGPFRKITDLGDISEAPAPIILMIPQVLDEELQSSEKHRKL